MKFRVDSELRTLYADDKQLDLYSDEAFSIISDLWLKVSWNQKYCYTMSWLGVPIIQLPEDIVRYQEAIYSLKPDLIIETGLAHGGSAILSASILKLIGKGRVIAVDIEIRKHNRTRIENHTLAPLITLIEGSSVSKQVLQNIRDEINLGETVLVCLDSNHSYAHVTAELEAYSPFVTPGCYIVATDGIMRDLADAPRGEPAWTKDNPAQAAIDFCKRNPKFAIEQPKWPFNESTLTENLTYWPMAWIKRVSD